MGRGRQSPRSLFVNLFGGFSAAGPRVEDLLPFERKKSRALLAVLALDPGRMVPRGKLTALLWEERSEEGARQGLRQCLLDLRQGLAGASIDVIRAEGDLISLDPSRVVVDVARFERRLAQSTPEALEDAVGLYRGDLLEGFSLEERTFENWLSVERERLRSQVVGALRRLLASHTRERPADAAIQVALRLLSFEPFDESVHRTLMRLYADAGRRSAALRQYEACVELLSRELGVEPEAATRQLYGQLVAERPRPGTASARAPALRKSSSAMPRSRLSFRSPVETPLVGRVTELQWLDALRERAHRGQPQLALVVGEAGIGKSRLIAELAAWAQTHRAEILIGRGREGEEVLPFAPWVEALRFALSEDLLGRLAPVTLHDLARLFPEIADGQVPPSGVEDGPRLFEAVVHVVRQLAATHPLVVVIEDLHWCDDMTLRLLRFLSRRLDGQPVLLLGTVRPEEITRGGDRGVLLEALRLDPACTARTLGPLSRDEAAQLFRALLSSRDEGPPAVLTERVWTVSEGNPFVVVECARAVRDRAAGSAGAPFELPEQVRALTTRSLAGLGARAGRLADLAAVIGRDFDVAVLRHAADLTEPEVADGMEELVRRRVLREADGRFDFSHDRVREVAYGRLLGPRRALLHRQVAQTLEAVYTDNLDAHCAAIGAHYRDAGVWPEACEYLARAGFQAFARGASREALTCFEDARQALVRLPDTEERRELGVRVRLAANGALVQTGQWEHARHYLHEAERLALTLPDRRWEGRVAGAMANSYRASGTVDRALRLGQRALEIALETKDRQLESVARFALGQAEHNSGNMRRALEHLTTLLSEETHDPYLAGRPALRAEARYWIAFCHIFLGEFDLALPVIDQSFRESDPQVDPLGTQRLLANISLGKLHNEGGAAGAAVQAFEAAFAIYHEDCHGNWNWPLAWGLGLAYARAGRVGEGLDLLEKAEVLARERSPNAFKPFRLVHLAEALLIAGQIDQAGRAAEEALRLAGEVRSSGVYAHWLCAEVARLRVPAAHEETERKLLAALTSAERVGRRSVAARCHLRLAWLYKKAGRPECERHRSAARALLESMGEHFTRDAVDEEALA